MVPLVRPYQETDREALLQIGAETAFFGAPIEAFMEDRRIFMDAFYAYYTDNEPEHTWIAADGDQILGFLTGCINTQHHDVVMRQQLIPAVAWKWMRGYYQTGPKLWRYVWAGAGALIRGQVPDVDLTLYPAHLHINLLPQARGQGLGRKLIDAYINQLTQLKNPGVHLHTTSYNVIACRLYERVGFQLLDARPTRMFSHLVQEPIENRCYGMQLTRNK